MDRSQRENKSRFGLMKHSSKSECIEQRPGTECIVVFWGAKLSRFGWRRDFHDGDDVDNEDDGDDVDNEDDVHDGDDDCEGLDCGLRRRKAVTKISSHKMVQKGPQIAFLDQKHPFFLPNFSSVEQKNPVSSIWRAPFTLLLITAQITKTY